MDPNNDNSHPAKHHIFPGNFFISTGRDEVYLPCPHHHARPRPLLFYSMAGYERPLLFLHALARSLTFSLSLCASHCLFFFFSFHAEKRNGRRWIASHHITNIITHARTLSATYAYMLTVSPSVRPSVSQAGSQWDPWRVDK